jgi:gliding motility-associated protein GldM
MAGGKLTPRQKMINMMYLVLTALLALNISKDILQALTKLESGLGKSAEVVAKKNAEVYAQFDKAAQDNPVKAGPWKDKAYEVKAKSDNLIKEIEEIKTALVEVTGGTVTDEAGMTQPKAMDNTSKVANMMLNEKKGDELQSKLEAFRESMKAHVADNPQLSSSIQSSFSTDDIQVGDTKLSWPVATFEGYPLIAVLAFLTDYQAKVRNTEADVIGHLQYNIGKSDLKFTGVRAMVMPKSNYIIQGETYEADVFLAAYDDTQDPSIVINGQDLPADQIVGGVGKISFPANSVGEVEWGGVIKLLQNGEIKEYPIEASYKVAPPSVVISPTKMNVLYRGVDNPLDIGVPGVDPSKIKVSGSGVREVGKGQYVADVTKVSGKEMTINVSVTDDEGNTKPMGKKEFRIKSVPDATGSQLGQANTLRSAGFIKNTPLQADLKDFPFDLELEVVSFEVVVPGFPPAKAKGNRVPNDVKQLIDQVKNGATIVFRNIKAKGPKGLRIDVSGFTMDVNN